MSTIDARREQMFPKLEPREIDRLRRFGEVRRYAAGEALFVTGDIAPGMCRADQGLGASHADAIRWGTVPRSWSRDPVSSSPKWGNCPASQRLSTSTRSTTWKRC